MLKDKNLEMEFHTDMLKIYDSAKSIGYKATKFRQMVSDRGGYSVAKGFIRSNKPTEGFIVLWELKRLDLTVEALVLNPKYQNLFTIEEKDIVRERLEEYGYNLPYQEQSYIITSDFPTLEPARRVREYNSYDVSIRDKVVFEYLFHSKSHRWIDENIIMLNPSESRGYQAMGILHHIGLKDKHKGLFEGRELRDIISELKSNSSDLHILVESLERYVNQDSMLGRKLISDIEAELSEEDSYYKEGAAKYYYGKRYERNPENRKRAIAIHGLSCKVCNFNFEEVYGERGVDFIEVHHINQLSTLKQETLINPEKDLVPLCSNCHRMIHRKKDEILTIEELKKIVQSNRRSIHS